jgi:hypothetical protein
MMTNITSLLEKLSKPKIWDTEPVFCFTTDIDWASEYVLEVFYEQLGKHGIAPHTFVTNPSKVIDNLVEQKVIETGIHPNFLAGSSHGNSFEEVINTCLKYVPNSWIYRSHRAFSATDTSHLLSKKYGHKVSSNVITILDEGIKPLLHESGMIEFPVFFEDGTHLYNQLDLNIGSYLKRFTSPGLKLINMHPMNFVINPPTIGYMRNIKDTISRERYNNLMEEDIKLYKNTHRGIADICIEIFKLSKQYKVVGLSKLYEIAIN